MGRLAAAHPEVDAVFCANDLIAIGALIRQTLHLFEEANSKGIEQWSIEWNKGHTP